MSEHTALTTGHMNSSRRFISTRTHSANRGGGGDLRRADAPALETTAADTQPVDTPPVDTRSADTTSAAERLGAAIFRARQARGISLRGWARAIGLSAHSGLVDYERGLRIPPRDIVVASEHAFGAAPGSIEQLLDAALLERARARADRLNTATRQAAPQRADGPVPVPVPCLIPPGVSDFVGRDGLVYSVAARLRPAPAGAAAWPLVVLTGPPGVGKSTLAVRLGHALLSDFPDGQLYVSLDRAEHGRLQPADVLAQFLRAFGFDGTALPTHVDDLVRLYRSLLANRRVLVILDGVRADDRIDDLLPNGISCGTLVTTRDPRIDVDGARTVEVPRLSERDAIRLLIASAQLPPDAALLAEAAALCRFCDGLPSAVRQAARLLRSHRQ